jgi:DNA-binding response OmpR family regulator
MTAVADLKVMALGNTMTIKRISDCVSNVGIELVSLTDTATALARLKQERFDIIVIDSLLNEAYSAVQSISELGCAPVALLTRENDTNWKHLRTWDVDGFVPEEAGNYELVARIKAISRRAAQTPDMITKSQTPITK